MRGKLIAADGMTLLDFDTVSRCGGRGSEGADCRRGERGWGRGGGVEGIQAEQNIKFSGSDFHCTYYYILIYIGPCKLPCPVLTFLTNESVSHSGALSQRRQW